MLLSETTKQEKDEGPLAGIVSAWFCCKKFVFLVSAFLDRYNVLAKFLIRNYQWALCVSSSFQLYVVQKLTFSKETYVGGFCRQFDEFHLILEKYMLNCIHVFQFASYALWACLWLLSLRTLWNNGGTGTGTVKLHPSNSFRACLKAWLFECSIIFRWRRVNPKFELSRQLSQFISTLNKFFISKFKYIWRKEACWLKGQVTWQL